LRILIQNLFTPKLAYSESGTGNVSGCKYSYSRTLKTLLLSSGFRIEIISAPFFEKLNGTLAVKSLSGQKSTVTSPSWVLLLVDLLIPMIR
jgi:hypothetical protein